MDTSILFNFLLNDPDGPVPSPWKRVCDIQTKLIYYSHNETGLMVLEFRPSVNIGGGVRMENSFWSTFIDEPIYHLMIRDHQNSHALPRLFIFRTSCIGTDVYGIAEQAVVRCPFCSSIIRSCP
ncbi:hypothetical protein SESBI_44537 [Sesbania bispinosa]|nr:hypothetical protein SESBI_44537 [Sesbania bispinosa]